MNPSAPWRWLAIVIPLGIVIALCAHWEPVIRDGWGHLYWYKAGNQLDASTLYDLLVGNWKYENPRLGQTVTAVLYMPGPLHVVVTTTFGLGLFVLLTTMVLGRWPSPRRHEDVLAFVTVGAIVAWCTPQFGPMLFYRPFFGNYTFGLCLQLLWLVPYRLQLAEPRAWRVWWSPLLFLLGIAAGMCNEHIGPPLLVAGLATTVIAIKRGDGLRPWMLLGLLGLAAGYALLMFAPGQSARYGGLAREAGVVERILDRGVVDNLRVFGVLFVAVVWALPWVAIGAVARRRSPAAPLSSSARLGILGLAGLGVLATFVLLGSPKIGPRLYLHSVALISCAVAAWVLSSLTSARARLVVAVLSCAVLAYVSLRCVLVYRVVGPMGEARIAMIRAAKPGTRLVVPRYPYDGDRYFLGDDFVATNLTEAIAGEYQLQAIELGP